MARGYTAFLRTINPPGSWLVIAWAPTRIDCEIAGEWWLRSSTLTSDTEWVILEDPETPQPRPQGKKRGIT